MASKTTASKTDDASQGEDSGTGEKTPKTRVMHVLYREAPNGFEDVRVFGDRQAAWGHGMSDRSLEYVAVPSGGSLAEAVKAARG